MLYSLTSQTLILALLISGVPLLLSAASGLIISVMQAATSIQDQTISYVVKLSTLILTLIMCGSWFLNEILELFKQTLGAIAYIGV